MVPDVKAADILLQLVNRKVIHIHCLVRVGQEAKASTSTGNSKGPTVAVQKSWLSIQILKQIGQRSFWRHLVLPRPQVGSR